MMTEPLSSWGQNHCDFSGRQNGVCAQFQRMSELLSMPLIPDSKLEDCVDRVYQPTEYFYRKYLEWSDKSISRKKKLASYQ